MTTFKSSVRVPKYMETKTSIYLIYAKNKSFVFGWQTHSVSPKLHFYLITASTYQKKFGNHEEGVF